MQANSKIKLAIVDDHQIVIDGIISLLAGDERYEVVHSCTMASEILAVLKTKQVHLLLTDIMMEPMNGVELARKVREQFPQVKVLALSMSGAGDMVDEMISDESIHGYVLKNIGRQELLNAIEKITNGGIYYSDEILKNLAAVSEQKKKPGGIKLTGREVEIIRLIEQEKNNKEIAAQLFISERTVETHRKNIFRKLGLSTAIGVIKYAYLHKLVVPSKK